MIAYALDYAVFRYRVTTNQGFGTSHRHQLRCRTAEKRQDRIPVQPTAAANLCKLAFPARRLRSVLVSAASSRAAYRYLDSGTPRRSFQFGASNISMIKLIYCITKKPGLTDEEFFHYWQNIHGPIGARIPHLRKLTQSHRITIPGDSRPPDFDGMAELWFDDLDAMFAARESPEWKASTDDEVELHRPQQSGLLHFSGARHPTVRSRAIYGYLTNWLNSTALVHFNHHNLCPLNGYTGIVGPSRLI